MALKDQISEYITPALQKAGYFLEDVNLVSPGQHRIVTVIVDGESALNLDQVTVASKLVSELLDEATFMGETPFTLEVTSPGIDRPLTIPRHFAKNVDRLLKVTKTDGVVITGRILSNTDSDLTLSVTEKKDVKEVVISLADIKRAQVEIEFNRKEGDK
ncbi:ribosome maturation factor RimP [Candidatus Planktophila dulcis]|uniref:Ribosome maturation factor RimP n=1 Tax=Candidatus Planktophila dulcis TaxID=1884914 RepID=A0AAD0E563_9ACTN|nr:ribosome maturation factor RimP [Candidatus Planktophila dulcis]ASY12214.1 ribosome maturation factor RimP [Candidatus Planktophila dulcis]ASY21461.1 ribosome maturation factor RimP [Candidatus Planktophila dulcis]